MSRKQSAATETGGPIIPTALYSINISKPVIHAGVSFIPARDRTYEVSGAVLDKITEFVSDYRRVG